MVVEWEDLLSVLGGFGSFCITCVTSKWLMQWWLPTLLIWCNFPINVVSEHLRIISSENIQSPDFGLRLELRNTEFGVKIFRNAFWMNLMSILTRNNISKPMVQSEFDSELRNSKTRYWAEFGLFGPDDNSKIFRHRKLRKFTIK